jgi:hypothetical protein
MNLLHFDHLTNNDVTETFCEIFSNLEQLSCVMKEPHYLLILLKRLSKLSTMTVRFPSPQGAVDLSSFEDEARKLNMLFRIECIEHEHEPWTFYMTVLEIWIGNSMN